MLVLILQQHWESSETESLTTFDFPSIVKRKKKTVDLQFHFLHVRHAGWQIVVMYPCFSVTHDIIIRLGLYVHDHISIFILTQYTFYTETYLNDPKFLHLENGPPYITTCAFRVPSGKMSSFIWKTINKYSHGFHKPIDKLSSARASTCFLGETINLWHSHGKKITAAGCQLECLIKAQITDEKEVKLR